MRPRPDPGFTLFEVAASLAILAVGVLSVLALFPAGIRAQRLARFQLYAAAKAIELVEENAGATNTLLCDDIEAPDPWDTPVDRRTTAPDLECRLASRRFGVAPLPTALARRLDSDDGEIARLLDQGAQLYYPLPQAPTSWDESALPRTPPSDLQSLVFAVSGYAQENALYSFAQKAWPYYAPWPSPPLCSQHGGAFADRETVLPDAGHVVFGLPGHDAYRCYLWEDAADPDVRAVLQWPIPADPDPTRNYGWLPYAYPSTPYALTPENAAGISPSAPTRDGAIRYLQAALWYCQRKGLWPALDVATPMGGFLAGTADADAWKQVQAMRFLAHAATCLTRWYDRAALDAGVAIAGADLGAGAGPSPAATIDHARIVAWHESSLVLAHRFRASFPYDWAVPRPYQDAVFTDYPLLQHDLFGPPLRGTIARSGGIAAAQWRTISAAPVTHLGTSLSDPDHVIDPTVWGDARRLSLAAPFSADERCRQLVFWAVDWRAYEDCETAASATPDASRYPIAAPRIDPSGNPWSFPARMNLDWVDLFIYAFRNPELPCLFTEDVSALPTGADVTGKRMASSTFATPDRGAAPANSAIFNGRHGADRDFDGALGRGPLPRSARLRAVTVARFNYYDVRVPCSFR